MISYDNGAIWNFLSPPKDNNVGIADSNHLHLHSFSSSGRYSPFYSAEASLGIILGTGNIGKYLEYHDD